MVEDYGAEGVLSSTVGAFLRMQREAEGPRPTACGTPLRGSQSWTCPRAVAFEVAGIPESNSPDDATLIAFRLGHSMHELIQDAMHAFWPGFAAEVQVDCRPLGFDLSGHADGVYELGDDKVVLEIKSTNSFAFKLAKKADAPKVEHVTQAAMYAIGLGADQIHMVYVAKEGSYRDGVKPGQLLEWRYRLDDLFDGETVEQIGTAELWRLQRVWERVKAGEVPERDVPGHGPVWDPPSYQGKGDPWNCRYCRYRDVCSVHPTEGVSVEFASETVRTHWNPPVFDEAGVTL